LNLVLYSTDHCALCEQALDLLLSMPEAAGATLHVVDVAGSEELVARYGARLPVLAVGEAEFAWPFTRATLSRWLAETE
jgi:hypothetical protein